MIDIGTVGVAQRGEYENHADAGARRSSQAEGGGEIPTQASQGRGERGIAGGFCCARAASWRADSVQDDGVRSRAEPRRQSRQHRGRTGAGRGGTTQVILVDTNCSCTPPTARHPSTLARVPGSTIASMGRLELDSRGRRCWRSSVWRPIRSSCAIPRVWPTPGSRSKNGLPVGAGVAPLPGAEHSAILGRLLESSGMTSRLVPDAHLAALAVEHGLTLCSTDGDFKRSPGSQVGESAGGGFDNPEPRVFRGSGGRGIYRGA